MFRERLIAVVCPNGRFIRGVEDHEDGDRPADVARYATTKSGKLTQHDRMICCASMITRLSELMVPSAGWEVDTKYWLVQRPSLTRRLVILPENGDQSRPAAEAAGAQAVKVIQK